jgi:hypothetical protein
MSPDIIMDNFSWVLEIYNKISVKVLLNLSGQFFNINSYNKLVRVAGERVNFRLYLYYNQLSLRRCDSFHTLNI